MPSVLPRAAALAVAGTFLWAASAHAQVDANLGGLTGENAEGYLAPLPQAFSAALNTSIFKSADIPVAGLSLKVGVEAMAVGFDEDLRSYTPSHPNYFMPANGGAISVPTVVGDTEAVEVEGESGTALYYPGGLNIEDFALAVPQLQFGNFMGTRGVLRYIALDLGDSDLGELELFGIGAQHSISQYFPLWPIDVAAGIFYQSFSVGDDTIDSNALHFGVQASKHYGVFEPYAVVGFDSYSFEVNYESDVDDSKVNVDFDSENDLHLTLGSNAHLGFFHINLELTQAATTTLALGLAVGM
jgi:hypothetical protein